MLREFPISRPQSKAFVSTIVKESGRETLFNTERGPSNEWCMKFPARHQDISKIEKVPRGIRGEKSSKDMASSRKLVSTNERTPEAMEKSWARMSNSPVMTQYFELTKSTVATLKPGQIVKYDVS